MVWAVTQANWGPIETTVPMCVAELVHILRRMSFKTNFCFIFIFVLRRCAWQQGKFLFLNLGFIRLRGNCDCDTARNLSCTRPKFFFFFLFPFNSITLIAQFSSVKFFNFTVSDKFYITFEFIAFYMSPGSSRYISLFRFFLCQLSGIAQHFISERNRLTKRGLQPSSTTIGEAWSSR